MIGGHPNASRPTSPAPRIPISQNWLDEYGQHHRDFRVPDLYSHEFLDPYATIEDNCRRLEKAVAAKQKKGVSWGDHLWAPKNCKASNPWPFNVPLDDRPTPASYCPGPGKPADTINGKCLCCAKQPATCFDGPIKDGKCTTCQGEKALEAYQNSIATTPGNSGVAQKPGRRTGKTRVCYWTQREFFLNDLDSARLFDKDVRYLPGNTAEAKAKRAQEKAEEEAAAAVAAQYRMPQSFEGGPAPPANAAAFPPTRQSGPSSILNAVGMGLVSAPVQSTVPAPYGTEGSGLSTISNPVLDPALFSEPAVEGQVWGNDIFEQNAWNIPGSSDLVSKKRSNKRAREDGSTEARMETKRRRTEYGANVTEADATQTHNTVSNESSSRKGSSGQARQRRGCPDLAHFVKTSSGREYASGAFPTVGTPSIPWYTTQQRKRYAIETRRPLARSASTPAAANGPV